MGANFKEGGKEGKEEGREEGKGKRREKGGFCVGAVCSVVVYVCGFE